MRMKSIKHKEKYNYKYAECWLTRNASTVDINCLYGLKYKVLLVYMIKI